MLFGSGNKSRANCKNVFVFGWAFSFGIAQACPERSEGMNWPGLFYELLGATRFFSPVMLKIAKKSVFFILK